MSRSPVGIPRSGAPRRAITATTIVVAVHTAASAQTTPVPVRGRHAEVTMPALGGHVMPQPHVKLLNRTVAEATPRPTAAPSHRLSRREREAVLALRDGKSRAAVAKHLGISVHTLGTVCKRAYRKLGINRVSQVRDVSID